MEKLRSTVSFREWHSGADKDELTYCGAKIIYWKIHHTEYLGKQKPTSFPKERQQKTQPVTEGERTALRGLLGALQWPSTQTAPWLQAPISMLAGSVSSATTSTLLEAKKVLRYAKQHSDVGLEFHNLGKKEDVTFIAFSDASFACRPDNSSQGGYLVAIMDRPLQEELKGITMWWIGAAESQAASEALRQPAVYKHLLELDMETLGPTR